MPWHSRTCSTASANATANPVSHASHRNGDAEAAVLTAELTAAIDGVIKLAACCTGHQNNAGPVVQIKPMSLEARSTGRLAQRRCRYHQCLNPHNYLQSSARELACSAHLISRSSAGVLANCSCAKIEAPDPRTPVEHTTKRNHVASKSHSATQIRNGP